MSERDAAVVSEPGMPALFGRILDRRIERVGLAAVGATAAAASLAETIILMVLSLTGLRLSREGAPAVDLPLGLPVDELSTVRLVVLGLMLVAFRFLLQLVNAGVVARLASAVGYRWRRRVLDAFQHASYESLLSEDDGHLQTVVQTYVTHTTTLVLQVGKAITAAVSLAVFGVGAIVVGWMAAAVLAGAGIVLFITLRPLTALSRSFGGRQRQAALEFSRLVGETTNLVQEHRTFDVRGEALAEIDVQLQAIKGAQLRQLLTQTMTPHAYTGMGFTAILVALGIASRLDIGDVASIGVITLLMVRSLGHGQTIQNTLQTLAGSHSFVSGLLTTVDRYERSAPTTGRLPLERVRELRMDGIQIAYGRESVLTDVHLQIEMGESVGIIGPSGAGKSSLVATLLGLMPPAAGAYLVNGQPVDETDPTQWHERVSFVAQEPKLFDGTVAENIRFHRSGFGIEQVRDAADAASLTRELEEWPLGLDRRVGPRGSTLSGGQRQRVCIARALLGHPDVLLLDEPTSALDTEAEEAITGVLASLRDRCTLVVVAHRLTTLEFCDRVLLVDRGSVVEIGSGRDIQTRSDLREVAERALEADRG